MNSSCWLYSYVKIYWSKMPNELSALVVCQTVWSKAYKGITIFVPFEVPPVLCPVVSRLHLADLATVLPQCRWALKVLLPLVNSVTLRSILVFVERQKSGDRDSKRISWNLDDVTIQLDTFRPVTLTVSSFFKQVSYHSLFPLVYSGLSKSTAIWVETFTHLGGNFSVW